ncbi:MAG: ABC transporter ATP-binding protein NatA [Bacteroidia bacterium]|nr:ABC transporter ATP-binding protein NatA [Bacteroidia bacterium]
MSAAAISIENLVHRYKDAEQAAVKSISLEIKEGEIFGLLGPNGAGKTTTISILSGLLKPTQGKVSIHSFDVAQQSYESKKLIGVVPQEIALYPTLTAKENLDFFGSMYGITKSSLKEKINHYLKIFGLENTGNKRVEQFSGGMKRRLNLIASLLHDPKILILDEPTASVDVQSRNMIIEFLRNLNRNGTTILYTSHYLEEAENLCTEIAIIDDGKIIIQGSPQEIIGSQPDFDNLENIFLKITGKKLRD